VIPRQFFWLFDFLMMGAAFFAAHSLFPHIQLLLAKTILLWIPWLETITAPPIAGGELPPLLDLLWLFLTIAAASLIVLGMTGNHRPLIHQTRTGILIGNFLAPLSGLCLVTMALYALKNLAWSRLFIFSFSFLCMISLAFYRIVLRRYYMFRQRAGHYAKNVLLIGQTTSIEWMASYFAENVSAQDYRLIGYLRVQADQPPPKGPFNGRKGTAVQSLMALGKVEELGDLLIHHPIDEMIAVHPESNGMWIKKVIQDCDYFGILLRIVPEALLLGERKGLKNLYPFEPLNLPAVILAPPHWDSDILFFKRLIDVVLSAVLLILFSPLFLFIAFAIKVSTPRLPIFYQWRVVGRNGVEFCGYKFTTMIADADERKADLMGHNQMNGPVFKIKKDPRVTSLGFFLRKYSLNELPQLWSVLKGDMSLVGPRPAFRHELERYEFWHKRKLSIKPGITCLWQVKGRNKINNFDEWVKMDLEYIDNWSLWLDFKILFRTVWVVVKGTGW
jgi:exopolysaccharide biosynthesis polyprenyl glycosylphosphotransferase